MRAGNIMNAAHQVERSALRVGHQGDSPDVRYVHRRHGHRPAGGDNAVRAGIDIVHGDIAKPHRLRAARFHFVGQLHQRPTGTRSPFSSSVAWTMR
tara:strand:+ start:6287 stop:6574 length:288 start_codon:yes stop_codon:yes gene_type:complete